MPKGFSEVEKENIRKRLIIECKQQWELFGYRKTNIDILCSKVGISKGAFYLFFPSKEQIFFETFKNVQNNLYALMQSTIDKEQNRNGLKKALKAVYEEYNKSSFLYNTTSTDFISFLNKLSEDERNSLPKESLSNAEVLLNYPFLKLRISKKLAISVLSSLLNTITNKEKTMVDHLEVFDFMVNNLIDEMFE